MATYIAWGNINQSYPLHAIPTDLLTEKLCQSVEGKNARVKMRHRCRWVAHFLLWSLLKTSQKPTALLKHIDYTDSGRPQLPDDEVDFNISHSGEWVAVILHINPEGKSAVGIDIEFPQRERNYAALLAHFAAQEEQLWFTQINPQQQHSAFYLSWCLREAVLKSQGVGIVKLSEVTHAPLLRQIQSNYCPTGSLIFTNELPFYLAFFINSDETEQINYYCWEGERLLTKSLQQKLIYQVNG
ncbi:TPA: 4'-phosphopantetheinyl transferase superfamily protein [Pasteurella multocida]|nr:4'-phosphopantetheinyl transferase superfamily protein [Pasteurella multocida]